MVHNGHHAEALALEMLKADPAAAAKDLWRGFADI
jgi:hypothetical protein